MISFSNFILGFKFALSYFTIIPVKINENDDLTNNQVLSSTLFSLPLIGLIIGFITIYLYGALEHLSWFGAIICVVFYMMLYGFIHTEAIIDVVDAIYAKHSGKDAYKVIKEPSVGAMGVLYAFAMVLLKIAGIVYLLMHNHIYEFLSIVVISRLMILFMIKNSDFKSSFVNVLKDALTSKVLFLSFLIFTSLNIYFINGMAVAFTIFAFLTTIFISKFIEKNVGFLNGDALGTTLETNEIFLIIFFLLFV